MMNQHMTQKNPIKKYRISSLNTEQKKYQKTSRMRGMVWCDTPIPVCDISDKTLKHHTSGTISDVMGLVLLVLFLVAGK